MSAWFSARRAFKLFVFAFLHWILKYINQIIFKCAAKLFFNSYPQNASRRAHRDPFSTHSELLFVFGGLLNYP